MSDSIGFFLADIIGTWICCCLLEKGISMLQSKKFRWKGVWAYFLIILAGTSLIAAALRIYQHANLIP